MSCGDSKFDIKHDLITNTQFNHGDEKKIKVTQNTQLW